MPLLDGSGSRWVGVNVAVHLLHRSYRTEKLPKEGMCLRKPIRLIRICDYIKLFELDLGI